MTSNKNKFSRNLQDWEMRSPNRDLAWGLSIVKNLVSLMKGKIDVSSHQGLGSIFTISLPMAAAEKQNVEPTQYRTKRQDSFTVIAIDDSHVQLSTIREAFASNGIVCDTCNNATDLLDMMRKKSYDLLITDLKMAEVKWYRDSGNDAYGERA